MRLLRYNVNSKAESESISDLVAAADLDFFQLDFDDSLRDDLPEAFLDLFRLLHRRFYLEERLRMVTNAGGGNVVSAIESLAQYLCEHDDPRMPISAIRGDNLLPRLAEFADSAQPLLDIETGANLSLDDSHILAAHVELGAGPIATAVADDARIVVVGCYDPAAPFIGAAVASHDLGWQQVAPLAQVALAAELSKQWQTVSEIVGPEVVLLEQPADVGDAADLLRPLQDLPAPPRIDFADVSCNTAQAHIEPMQYQKCKIAGEFGEPPSGHWRVRVVVKQEDGQPSVRWSTVPRELINVSVDTRIASEWL